MAELRYLKNVVTLAYDADKCIGCKKCTEVCPHAVFVMEGNRAVMVDPDAMIQTGPGLPNWRWHSYAIRWDGPVQMNQNIELTLVTPAAHRSL